MLLSVSSSYSGKVNGVQATIGFPSGVTLRTGSNSAVDAGTVVVSGASGQVQGRLSSGTLHIGFISGEPVGIGEFAIFYCDVPAGLTVTAESFTPVATVKIVDAKGNVLTGISVEVF